MKKSVVSLFALGLILTGCGQTEGSSSTPSSPTGPDSSESSSLPDSSIDESQLEYISTNIFRDEGVTVSDVLFDLAFMKYVVKDKTYSFSIKASNSATSEVQIEYSNPGIVSIEGNLDDGFKLNCLRAGGTVVVFRYADGAMLYRTAINVRSAKTSDEVVDYMVNEVKYYSFAMGYDSYQLTMTSESEGVMQAKEGTLEYLPMNFTYSINPTMRQFHDMWGYDISVKMVESSSPIMLTNFFVTAIGDTLNVYDNGGIIGIFTENL